MKSKIAEKFRTLFGKDGEFFTSAGRINLIGEHTDYNGGFVFPGAVDKGIIAEIMLNGTDKVCAYSIDIDEYVEFGLNEEDAPTQSWARYIFGVCRETVKRGGKIGGFNTVFAGDVPLGAGMSSSAALESTFAFALNYLFNLKIDKFELARIGQATEHNYCGVKCGIMDQFASIFGKKGNLIRLDCKTMEYKYFPFNPEGYRHPAFHVNDENQKGQSRQRQDGHGQMPASFYRFSGHYLKCGQDKQDVRHCIQTERKIHYIVRHCLEKHGNESGKTEKEKGHGHH